jgi:O-antigen/teichoic acid export membrane protein
MRWPRAGIGGAFRAAAALMTGRSLGFAVTFAIPLVLVRVLDQHAFGTYKYLFMIASTLNVLQLGMAESLYYFVPRRTADPGPVTTNAVVMMGAVGGALVALMTVARQPIAGWLGDPAIAGDLPLVAIFVALMLIAAPLEIVMVSRKAYRAAALTYAGSDAARSILMLVPGILLRTLGAVLWGAIAFAALRVVALAAYLRGVAQRIAVDRSEWRAQMAYTGPFAVAVIIETIQLNLHQYVVWARFDPATFAIYAAGCLQIPLVDVLTTSVGNVMMVRMTDEVERPDAALALWHQAVERLAFWLWPWTVALVLTAHDVIVLLFTPRYAASVPIFAVSTLAIALGAFQVDSVLRVYARTRFLIVMNLIRLAVVAGGIAWAVATFQLIGAIGITIAGMATAKAVALWKMSSIFGVPITRVLPWGRLARTAAIALVAAAAMLWIRPVFAALPVLLHGASVAALYAAIYLVLDVLRRAPEALAALVRPLERVDRP